MLVVDSNKSNLLKMKEKLLEVGIDKDKNLTEYKQLVTEIDNEVFASLMKKIENTNLHDLSLEEQLVVLSQIDAEYVNVYEIQCGFRNTYQKYCDDKLELSDLSVILIDDIKNRINNIQGYLININSIKNGKKDLEKLNLDLIRESKKKDNLFKKFNELENELKNNFLNAEGRNYDSDGNLVYSSIINEYNSVSLNLKNLLEDNLLLESEIDNINKLKKASDEKLLAAKICYDRMPTNENKDIFDTIRRDALQINYKLVLLYMANLISKECSEYSSIILKRKQILSLNEERLSCLDQLGVKISIDPFARIRVNEQSQIISTLGDNSEQIEVIKRKIGNLDRLIDEKVKDNNEFMLQLSNDIQLLRKTTVDVSSNELKHVFDVDNPTKVINVKDLTDEIIKNKNKISEQTDGVIKRVNAMFHENDVISINDVSSDEVIPTLVVKPSIETPLFDNSIIPTTAEEIPESIIDVDNNQIEVSDGLLPVFGNSNIAGVNQGIVSNVNTAEIKESTPIFEDNNNAFNDDILPDIDLSTQEVTSEANETKTEEKVEFEDDSNNIFNDVSTPFESVSLFNDRVSDETDTVENNLNNYLITDTTNLDSSNSNTNSMSNDNNSLNTSPDDSLSKSMPDMFWMVDESSQNMPKENESDSFDSQIDALIGKTKVKEKVL